MNLQTAQKGSLIIQCCFLLILLTPSAVIAQQVDPLKSVKQLIHDGWLEKAVGDLDRFIGRGAQTEYLAEAHYLRAKIYYTVLENERAEADLRRVYELLPGFNVLESDFELKSLAERIRNEVLTKRQDELRRARELLGPEMERQIEELKRAQEALAEALERMDFEKGSQESDEASVEYLKIEMVRIPGGSFPMGANSVVNINTFYLGKYELTQGEWKSVMNSKRSSVRKDDYHPVERVSWDDVQEFIAKLNQMTGKRYRLPTEAEWEYAARGGTSGDRYGKPDDIAWYKANSGNKTHPVGQKLANGYGLYDMLGNVWEWVQDWYDNKFYSRSFGDNPVGPSSGSLRVFRGGSWRDREEAIRVQYRLGGKPGFRDHSIGFRLAADSL